MYITLMWGHHNWLQGATEMRAALLAFIVVTALPGLMHAQTELSVYGGLERVADSRVSGDDRSGRHVTRDDAAGTHQGVLANGNSP